MTNSQQQSGRLEDPEVILGTVENIQDRNELTQEFHTLLNKMKPDDQPGEFKIVVAEVSGDE